jgi:hypothetical protein
MPPLPLSFLSRSQARRTVLLALAAGVVALTLAACGGSDADEGSAPAESSETAEAAESAPSDFEAAMLAASDRVEQAFEEIEPASDEGIRPGVFGENAPAMSAALTAYAVELEGLDPPEEFREELARVVSALEDNVTLFAAVAAADAARDSEELDSLLRELEALDRNVRAGLSPEFAALVYLDDGPVPDLFVGLSPEDSDYFDSVDAAGNEFAKRSSAFGAAINGTYVSTEALLNALYDAGAGEAWEAVQQVALTIEPPARFESEHELWLALLEELVRLDVLIGEGARDGDIIAFELNNHLLGLALTDAASGFSPEFATTIGAAPGRLDPESALAATPYGPELDAVVRSSIAGTYFFFDTTPQEAVLETIPLIAPEFRARIEDSRASVEALTPPVEYASDHAAVLEHFDALLAHQDAIGAALDAGDVGALTTLIAPEATEDIRCATAANLSDEVALLVTDIRNSEEPPPFCSE